ncbi:MAG TPA: beta-ketoacyl synthase chain length factor [Steroidobacteraceae bacterium]|nr:beta-ketoacyl synthase chain length factor [Steroidobacteraceae bacterium]
MHPWELYVEGIGLWAPRLAGWSAARSILRGESAPPEVPASRPTPALLPQTERRRAPDTVAIALEVAASACAAAGCLPQELPSVFASAYGDLAVSDAMCEQLARSPLDTSPTKFHHSVHNAAAGYWAIATGCLAPYTALAAHRYTFAAGLLAAAVQALERTRVLFVAYDVEGRGPIATMARSRGMLGTALLLAPERTLRSRIGLDIRVEKVPEGVPASATPARASNAALVEGNAIADGLTLFEALADETERSVTLTLSAGLALEVSVRPMHP